MNKTLNYLLNDCWGGVIKNVNFDLLNNKILISIDVIDCDKTTKYNIDFYNVSSFYFLNEKKERRLFFIEPNYLWLTSIDYFGNEIGKINIYSENNKWKDFYSGANFIIEICDRMNLFIEAEAIQINDQYFHVGFPKIDKDNE